MVVPPEPEVLPSEPETKDPEVDTVVTPSEPEIVSEPVIATSPSDPDIEVVIRGISLLSPLTQIYISFHFYY